jgi:glycosyltransferase involved in cell wall biosynthesis
MKVLFEELAGPHRVGGIEAATSGLIAGLMKQGVLVTRTFADGAPPVGFVPDCVHLHGIWSPTLAWRFLGWRLRGVPCVVTLHGMLEPWAMAHKALKKKVAWNIYQKGLLNMASVLHATSDREAANLRKLVLKRPIAMIPWGVEMANEGDQRIVYRGQSEAVGHCCHFSPVQNSNSKIQNQTRTAIFLGRIHPVKGLPMLVEAWAKVRPEGWKMLIVGPDEAGHLAQVQELVQRAGLGGEFVFTGPLSGALLQDAYRHAHLYIQPSYTENFGMAIAEAMSHRLPVITTHGAPWKLLLDERCGWWVPVSLEGIASALDLATRSSPEALAAMGARGRAVVVNRFAWERISGEFVNCYRWLLRKCEKPGCVNE